MLKKVVKTITRVLNKNARLEEELRLTQELLSATAGKELARLVWTASISQSDEIEEKAFREYEAASQRKVNAEQELLDFQWENH